MLWKKVVWRGGALAALVLAPAVGIGATVPTLTPVPNTFVPGAVISSSEVNANFDTVEGSLAALQSALNTNATHMVIRADNPNDGSEDYMLAANCQDATKIASGGGCKATTAIKASYPITTVTPNPNDFNLLTPSVSYETPIGWCCITADTNQDVAQAFAVCTSYTP